MTINVIATSWSFALLAMVIMVRPSVVSLEPSMDASNSRSSLAGDSKVLQSGWRAVGPSQPDERQNTITWTNDQTGQGRKGNNKCHNSKMTMKAPRSQPFVAVALFVSICFIVAGFDKVLKTFFMGKTARRNALASTPGSGSNAAAGVNCRSELPSFFRGITEKKVFSQQGEDGVIDALLTRFGSPQHKYYVEFGTEAVGPDYGEYNARLLREKGGYQGLLMDGNNENRELNQQMEFITAFNINDLFAKYLVPLEFNLLSIDVNFDDYFVWQAIDKKYRPRLVIIEYNSKLGPTVSKTVNLKHKDRWTLTDYFGASYQAFKQLGESKGYTLVFGESMGVNLFFVRTDLLQCPGLELNDEDIFKPPRYGNGGHPTDETSRKWVMDPNPNKFPDEMYPPSVD